ncbi:MAG: quinone-dependent dihydroorotate dehydrogenase [Pseudomonadota bacterium]
MSALERAGLAVLGQLDPERAHGLALTALRLGLGPKGGPIVGPRLGTRLAGLALPNPIGIAAGFDKNAESLRPLLRAGPGFVEIGAVTPRPQTGNPRPRLFRLVEDRAAINRFGFNNDGMEAIRPRLLAARGQGVVGVNLGANKDSPDRAGDYALVLRHLYDAADFFTVNVSSPNTERLRDLQGRAALEALLARVLDQRVASAGAERPKPLFLKIAPDLTEGEIADIAAIALEMRLDAVIATNTTVRRSALQSPHADQSGGLSGAPLFQRSTQVLRALYRLSHGQVPLIGVGGVRTAADAYAKIRAGAQAVQLYTALAYGGLSLVSTIARELADLLEADGLNGPADAVGLDAK